MSQQVIHNIKKYWKKICNFFLKKGLPLLITLIFLIPPFLSLHAFVFSEISFKIKTEKPNDGILKISILKEEVRYPAYQDMISKLLQIPLNLNHYNVCFQNKSYKKESGKKEFLPLEDVTLIKSGDPNNIIEQFDMLNEDYVCKNINLYETTISKGTYQINFNSIPQEIETKVDITTTPTASLAITDKIIGVTAFTLGLYGIFLIIREVYLIISKRIMELKKSDD